MPLHADAQRLLSLIEQLRPPAGTVPETRMRQRWERVLFGPAEPVAAVRDLTIPGPAGPLAVRIYTPAGQTPFPVLCFLHGGGWVLGDLDHSDHSCRALTNAARCVVVAVGYRLAPEHKFPASLHDVYAAVRWISDHHSLLGGDDQPIAVAGDSAGGNLAAAVALLARDIGAPKLSRQILIYPVMDWDDNTDSYRTCATGFGLTRTSMREFWEHYLPQDAGRTVSPYAAPLRAKRLDGLAPALVITAEYDVLRDEAETYAARLEAAGVPVHLHRYAGQVHAFWSFPGVVSDARAATREVGRMLRGTADRDAGSDPSMSRAPLQVDR